MIRLCLHLDHGVPCNEEAPTPLGCCPQHDKRRHGKWGTYVRGCRCPRCTRAAADYQRQRKREAKSDPLRGHDWTWDRIAEVMEPWDRKRMAELNEAIARERAA